MPLDDRPIVFHRGRYKRTATTAEAVFMITGMTIGAGILGLPKAIAGSGLLIGLGLLVGLGLAILALHLMIAEVATHIGQNLQLPGLVGHYFGRGLKTVLSVIIIFSALGSLLAYVVGEGHALSSLFGGTPLLWSLVFWGVASFLVWGGLQRVKFAEKALSFSVMLIIVGLSLLIAPHIQTSNLLTIYPEYWFLPYGVILFALHGAPAIAEAHALLPHNHRKFQKAVFIGTLLPMLIYIIFTVAVVGVFGASTSEIATTGLSARFGRGVALSANLFAILAMSTGFMGLATALKETLTWDYQVPREVAFALVLGIPLILFLAGVRSFIGILQFVGGVLLGIEALLMVAVYWRARQRGDIPRHGSFFHRRLSWPALVPIAALFGFFTLLSLAQLLY